MHVELPGPLGLLLTRGRKHGGEQIYLGDVVAGDQGGQGAAVQDVELLIGAGCFQLGGTRLKVCCDDVVVTEYPAKGSDKLSADLAGSPDNEDIIFFHFHGKRFQGVKS